MRGGCAHWTPLRQGSPTKDSIKEIWWGLNLGVLRADGGADGWLESPPMTPTLASNGLRSDNELDVSQPKPKKSAALTI